MKKLTIRISLLLICFYNVSFYGQRIVATSFETNISNPTIILGNSSVIRNDSIQQNLNSLFKKGQDGYACYRIPAVVKSNSGVILAFCEARKDGCSDTGNIALVMKKSVDNGKTWSSLKIIIEIIQNLDKLQSVKTAVIPG